MTTCSAHPGCLVVFNEDTACPVCHEMAFVREFEVKLLGMEKDIGDMKVKNRREMGDMASELITFIGRPRV